MTRARSDFSSTATLTRSIEWSLQNCMTAKFVKSQNSVNKTHISVSFTDLLDILPFLKSEIEFGEIIAQVNLKNSERGAASGFF